MFRVLHVACGFPGRSIHRPAPREARPELGGPTPRPCPLVQFSGGFHRNESLKPNETKSDGVSGLMEKSHAPHGGGDPLQLPAAFSSSFPRFYGAVHPAALRSAGPDSPCGFPPGDRLGLQTASPCPRTQRRTPLLVHHLDVASSFFGLNRCSVLGRWGVTFVAEPRGTWGSSFLPGSFAQPTVRCWGHSSGQKQRPGSRGVCLVTEETHSRWANRERGDRGCEIKQGVGDRGWRGAC